jgi:outer membrane protein
MLLQQPARADSYQAHYPTFDVFAVTPREEQRPLPGDPTARDGCGYDNEQMVARSLDLQQAVNMALCRNPQTRVSWANVLSQAAQLGTAKAAYLPSVSASLNRTSDAVDTSQTGNGADLRNDTSVTAYGRNATVSWLLFDLGTRSANIEQARQSFNAALASQDAALQTVFANTAQAYYDTWAAQAAADGALEAEASARENLTAAQSKLQLGAGTKADELQARAALGQAILTRVRAQGNAKLALGTLASALGLDARTDLHLIPDPSLSDTAAAPPAAGASTESDAAGDPREPAGFLRNLDAMIADANQNHPAIRAALAQVAAAIAKRDSVVAEGLPSISTSVSRYINGRPNTPLTQAHTFETLATIQLQVPLFEGFGRNYRIRDAEAQIQAREADLATARSQTSLDIWRNYQTLLAETTAMSASVDLVHGAQEAAEAARARYHSGSVDILEVLTAQKDLASAKQERIRSLAAWRTARLKLLASLGSLGFWALDGQASPSSSTPSGTTP